MSFLDKLNPFSQSDEQARRSGMHAEEGARRQAAADRAKALQQANDFKTDNPVYWGGSKGAADSSFAAGQNGQATAGLGGSWAGSQAKNAQFRGPMASENQQLTNNEAQTRGFDQAGALQLQREAAMGNAPSAAQMQMGRGLDSALAQQQAQMGSARGAAGIALAGGNAAANSAQMSNSVIGQAGQLRAQEMAQARGAYGDLASAVRGQDQSRIAQGNQMSQFNAGLNDQYALGMGGLQNQFGTQGLGWYQGSQNPYNQQLGADVSGRGGALSVMTGANLTAAQEAQARLLKEQADKDRFNQTLGLGLSAVGGVVGGVVGGPAGAKAGMGVGNSAGQAMGGAAQS